MAAVPPGPGLTVREAAAADNEALIALELGTPIVVGNVEETYDRSPDFFAAHRVQSEHRIVVGELNGRLVGIMAGVIQEPRVQGLPRRLVYIHRARVHPDARGRRVAWAMANDLFAWAGARGAEGPYYLIAPGNMPSNEFVERGGGRWPQDVTLLELGVSRAAGSSPERVWESDLPHAVDLVNATHAGEDFFQPLTLDSLAARLGRDPRYGLEHLRGVYEGGTLVAVAGLWDRGATGERIQVDRTTGAKARSRGAAAVDWGWAPGYADAFAALLRGLAAEARALGRSTLMVCEPSPGALPNPGLPAPKVAVHLYTPTIQPPQPQSIRGLFADLLHV